MKASALTSCSLLPSTPLTTLRHSTLYVAATCTLHLVVLGCKLHWHATCDLQRAACSLQPALCDLQPATCNLQPATCSHLYSATLRYPLPSFVVSSITLLLRVGVLCVLIVGVCLKKAFVFPGILSCEPCAAATCGNLQPVATCGNLRPAAIRDLQPATCDSPLLRPVPSVGRVACEGSSYARHSPARVTALQSALSCNLRFSAVYWP